MRTFLAIMYAAACINASAQSSNRTIYFDSGKAELSDTDAAWLDSVAAFLTTTAGYSIDIKAYCDAVGTDEMNAALAKRRAAAVEHALLITAPDKTKIVSNSFGENEPVADNATEAGKAKNRRAVVNIKYRKEAPPVLTAANDNAWDDDPSVALQASNMEVGKTLVLKNMNFEGGTAVLLPESEPTLKELLKLMKENPTLEIEIGGHVCCGPDMPLSVLRAQKVYLYLAGYGINKKRMSYKGYSFDKPLTPDITQFDKNRNRRVEITVLKK